MALIANLGARRADVSLLAAQSDEPHRRARVPSGESFFDRGNSNKRARSFLKPFAAAFATRGQTRRFAVPKALFCPDTRQLYRDPVFCFSTKKTYERSHLPPGSDPASLVPNFLARKLAETFAERGDPRIPTAEILSSLLVCPISLERFEQPIIARDGHSYDAACWVQLLERPPRSPMTRALLPKGDSRENDVVASVMREAGLLSRSRQSAPLALRAKTPVLDTVVNAVSSALLDAFIEVHADPVGEQRQARDDAQLEIQERTRLKVYLFRAQRVYQETLRAKYVMGFFSRVPSEKSIRASIDALTLLVESTESARLKTSLFVARATCFALLGSWEIAQADLFFAESTGGNTNAIEERRQMLFSSASDKTLFPPRKLLMKRLETASTVL